MQAHSATYYVDATQGNDNWPGRQSAPTGNDGPWQSLARVQSAQLLPGDQVMLKCGQVWREPLVINRSGTAASPIRVQSYPAGCPDLPLIDGSIPISGSSWSHYSGAIYRATSASSLIPNANFDQGVSSWRRWSPTNSASIAESSDCGSGGSRCLLYSSGNSVGLTALSSPGFSIEPQNYTISFNLKAPLNTAIRAVVRYDGYTYAPLGFDKMLVGTGAWQTYTFTFRGTTRAPESRLDFEVPSDKSMSLDNVVLATGTVVPVQAFVNGEKLEVAHHPNRGRAIKPSSVYASNAADSNQQAYSGGTGSSYIVAGADLALPPGASITPGTDVFVRTVSWLIDDRKVTAFSGSTISLDKPTTFHLAAGWGYYLTGSLWMLDSPGEWHHDPQTNAVYIWMPDGAAPGDRVALGQAMVGIDVSNTSYVMVEGIAVRRVNTAVKLANANAAVISGVQVSDTRDVGIDASGSVNSTIENSAISRTGRDAIAGLDRISWRMSDGLRVVNNTIRDAGVRLVNGVIESLPLRSFAAIHAGRRAYVARNRVVNAGYIGIWPRVNSTVEFNYVENSCLVLDDCGGIYVGDAVNSVVSNNMVISVPGATDGKPSNHNYTQAAGIFLDDSTSGVTVADNVVTGADWGVLLHNAFNNTIRSNVLYGNRVHQLWLQEDNNHLRPNGDVYGNVVTRNVMAPLSAAPAVGHTSYYADVYDFATYSGNIYSGLLSPRMARELWKGGEMVYDFGEWRAATTPGGAARSLDTDGVQVTLGAFASLQVTGSNLVPNGNLSAALAGWSSYSAMQPAATMSVSTCPVGACLRYAIGGAPAVVSSPNFSVAKGQWYRVSFDLMTGSSGQPVRWVVRRGGGGSNGYEYLMGGEQKIFGTTSWKRYAYTFQATDTVNARDPVTRDLGARVDFQGDTANQQIWLANVEVVPVTSVGSQLRTHLITNRQMTSQLVDCPDNGADSSFCSKYIKFNDATPIVWPYSLPALGAAVIYSRGDTLSDADADGIADMQDRCPGTSSGQQVDSLGCAIGQVPR